MRNVSGNQKKQRRIRFSRAAAVGTVALLFQCGPGGMATSWGVDCLFENSPSRNYCVDSLADDLPTDNSWTLRKAVNDANNLSSDTSTAVVKFKPTLFLEPAPTPTPTSTQTPEPQPSTVVVQRTITLNSTLEIKTNIAIIGPSTSSGDPLKTADGNHALKIERGSAVASGTPLIEVNPTSSPTPEPTPTPTSSSTPEPTPTPTSSSTPEPTPTSSSTPSPQQSGATTEVVIKNVEIDSRVSIPTPGPSAPATVAGEGSVVKVNPSPSLNTSLNTTPESSQSESPPTPASETSTVTVKLEGVKVVNSLSDSGGAVISTPGNVEVTNSQLIGNQAGRSESFGNAVPETTLPPADGGAIKAGGDVSIINSTLSGNKSTGSGGAVSAGGDVTISNSSAVNNNQAQGDGGAVASSNTVSISNSQMRNNDSEGAGGAVSAGGNVTISDSSTINSNQAQGDGGAIATLNAVSISNSQMSNNDSEGAGGAVSAGGNVTISDSSYIFSNFAAGSGGAVSAGGNVTISDSTTISSNVAQGDGGAVSAGGDVTISSSSTPSTPSTISSNVAQGDGGAVHAGGVVSINNSNLDNNTSGGSGGAVSTESPVLITNGGLGYNHAAGSGGAVNAGSTVEIINSTLDHNQANADGGAVSAAGAVVVSNSLLSDNTAANSGGAIRASSVEANLSTFFGNRASNGGALLVEEAVDIQSSSFEANWAVPAVDGDEWDFVETLAERVFGGDATPEDENGFLTTSIWNGGLGGAIFIGGIFDSVSNIFDTTFGLNRARVGGAIHGNLGGLNIATSDSNVDWGSQLLTDSDIAGTNCPWADSQPHMSTSTSQSTCFIQNHSLDSGGAIAHAGNLQIANSIFDGNSSGNIFVDTGEFLQESTSMELFQGPNEELIFQTYLANRLLFADGGAIHVEIQNYFPDENLELPQNSVHITNSLFEDNYAGGDGGAVVFQGLLYVLASRFKGNSVIFGNGGAIASNSIQVSASKFDQNFANCNGYSTWQLFESSDFTEFLQQNGCMGFFSEGPTLIYNDYYANNGGAIFTEEASIFGSEFLGNEARGDGGAIFSFNVSVENSLFHEHNISNPWFDNEELTENEDYDPREYIDNLNYDPRETVPNSNYNGQETIDNPDFNQVAELLTPNRDENIQYCGARHHSMSFQDGNYTFCSESITYPDGINVAPSGQRFYTSEYMPNPAYDPRATIANPAYDPVQFLPNPDFDEREFLPNPEFDPVQFVENPDYDNREFLSLGNRAGRRGGAIAIFSYSDESDQLTNTIVNTDFIGNKAGISGGAIDIFYDGETDIHQMELTVNDSTFESNASQFFGGAIAADGVVMSTESSLFEANYVIVEEYNEDETYGGGAIWIDGQLTVGESQFVSNSVQLRDCTINSELPFDGDICTPFIYFQIDNEYDEVSFDDFLRFHDELSGGAIKIESGVNRHIFSDTNFLSNSSLSEGGAIHAGFGAELEFIGLSTEGQNSFGGYFSDNFTGLYGGAISGASLLLEIQNYNFNSNHSIRGEGGAISWRGIVDISDSTFHSNEAANHGGAIDLISLRDSQIESDYFQEFLSTRNISGNLVEVNLKELLKSSIADTYFINNVAQDGDGGAIDGTEYDLTVSSTVPLTYGFISNIAGDNGGAIWMAAGSVLEISGIIFDSNESGEDGGALEVDTVQVKNSRFSHNYAEGSGGAIKILNNSLRQKLSIVIATEFFENGAEEGGAIAGSPWIVSSTLINNHGNNGSAISMSGTIGTLLLTSFIAGGEEAGPLCGNQSEDSSQFAFFNTAGTLASDDSCFSNFPLGLPDIPIGAVGTIASDEALTAIREMNSDSNELELPTIARSVTSLLPKYEMDEFFGADNLYFALLENGQLFDYYIDVLFPNSLNRQNESGEWQTHEDSIEVLYNLINEIFQNGQSIPQGIAAEWEVYDLLDSNDVRGDRFICPAGWEPDQCYWITDSSFTNSEAEHFEQLEIQMNQNQEGMLYLDYPSIFGDEFILGAVSQDILGRNRTRLTLGTPGAYELQLDSQNNENSGGGGNFVDPGDVVINPPVENTDPGRPGNSDSQVDDGSLENSSNEGASSPIDEAQLQLLRQLMLENALKVQAELDRIAKELAERRAQELAAKAAAAAKAKAQRKAIRDAKRKFTADLAAKIAARKKAKSELVISVLKPMISNPSSKTNPKKSFGAVLVAA